MSCAPPLNPRARAPPLDGRRGAASGVGEGHAAPALGRGRGGGLGLAHWHSSRHKCPTEQRWRASSNLKPQGLACGLPGDQCLTVQVPYLIPFLSRAHDTSASLPPFIPISLSHPQISAAAVASEPGDLGGAENPSHLRLPLLPSRCLTACHSDLLEMPT